MPTKSDVTQADGSIDFSGGVNSIKVTTIQSQANPDGLARNELAWLDNGTVRDGGITTITGWDFLKRLIASGLYQGGSMYEPDSANPYLIALVSGHLYKVDLDTLVTLDLSAMFNLFMPATQPQAYFVQAELFLVIQAGDNSTLPLFWDGTKLRRSKGITNRAVAPGTPGVNEIPAATAMDYYQSRLWYAQGRQYSAGDIVGGSSGTIAYTFRDAVLNVTENPLVLSGDGFTVPTNAGNIRALKHSANLDTTLGQGNLYIFTRKAVYSQQVPVTRADWIAANSNNQPVQTVVQLVNGSVNDRSVVAVNGDLFYQSLEPGIRSLITAIRYFQQWGNVSISANEERILQFNDRALLHAATGVTFDNRLIQSALPKQTDSGIVHQALVPMDFIPVSTFGAGLAPVWEGMYEGLDFFQLFTGDFGGLERCFAIVLSRIDQGIDIWELTDFLQGNKNKFGDARTTMIIEFPAYTWGDEFMLKKLVSAELWVDRLIGTVDFTMEWRVDSDQCRKFWHKWQQCSARNSCEDALNPICYPLKPFSESFRATMTLPNPPETCETTTGRPAHIGYQFQPVLTIKGFCRIRGILLHAEQVDRKLYQSMVCEQYPTEPGSLQLPTPVPPGPIPPPVTQSFTLNQGSDPILGPPYPAVDYELLIACPANGNCTSFLDDMTTPAMPYGGPNRLGWSVPDLFVAPPTNNEWSLQDWLNTTPQNTGFIVNVPKPYRTGIDGFSVRARIGTNAYGVQSYDLNNAVDPTQGHFGTYGAPGSVGPPPNFTPGGGLGDFDVQVLWLVRPSNVAIGDYAHYIVVSDWSNVQNIGVIP
jgi:hypothetical protein